MSDPVVSGGAVYVTTAPRSNDTAWLRAHSSGDGASRWSKRFEVSVLGETSSPYVRDDQVIVGYGSQFFGGSWTTVAVDIGTRAVSPVARTFPVAARYPTIVGFENGFTPVMCISGIEVVDLDDLAEELGRSRVGR